MKRAVLFNFTGSNLAGIIIRVREIGWIFKQFSNHTFDGITKILIHKLTNNRLFILINIFVKWVNNKVRT